MYEEILTEKCNTNHHIHSFDLKNPQDSSILNGKANQKISEVKIIVWDGIAKKMYVLASLMRLEVHVLIHIAVKCETLKRQWG